MADRCRGCNKKLIWGVTDEGKILPLDAVAPVYDVIDAGMNGDRPAIKIRRSTVSYVSHFATCPEAGSFSASRKTADTGA